MKKNKIHSLEWTDYPEYDSYRKGLSGFNHGPAFGWIEVSTVCNLRCNHCFISQKGFTENYAENPNNFIDMEIFELWCRKILPFLHGVSLEGTTGEAFLHPEIDHIISKITDSGTVPTVVTNGTIVKEKTMEKIFKSGGKIGISLDGITPETYNKIRKGADFNKVWENILHIQSIKEKTGGLLLINTVYQKDNWFELEELIEKSLASGVDMVLVSEHRPSHYSYPEKIDLSIPEEAFIYLEKCYTKFSKTDKVAFNFYSYHEAKNYNNTCCSPWIHIWTGVKGDCRICCIGDEHFWVNMSGCKLEEAFDIISFSNKKELIAMRENMLKGIFPDFCKNCHLCWGINSPAFNRD